MRSGVGSATKGSAKQEEPLLGRVGDVVQGDNQPYWRNLFSGTASLAQIGAWTLGVVVWKHVFTHELNFFSPHPLLNSTALLLSSQAMLIVQPANSESQRKGATWIHFFLNTGALAAFIGAFSVIETIKSTRPEIHFKSVHSILGITTYAAIVLQAFLGLTQYFTPWIYGGAENAKKTYKWHRLLGYSILVLALTTVVAATRTDYNKRVLNIPTKYALGSGALVLTGIFARIKKNKMPAAPKSVPKGVSSR